MPREGACWPALQTSRDISQQCCTTIRRSIISHSISHVQVKEVETYAFSLFYADLYAPVAAPCGCPCTLGRLRQSTTPCMSLSECVCDIGMGSSCDLTAPLIHSCGQFICRVLACQTALAIQKTDPRGPAPPPLQNPPTQPNAYTRPRRYNGPSQTARASTAPLV